MTVTIDGQPCNMFIDTGALGVILNSKYFDHNINGHVMGSGGRGVDWQQVTSLSIDGTHHFLHKGGIVVLPLGVVGQVSSFDYFDFMKKLPQKDMKKQKKREIIRPFCNLSLILQLRT